MIKTVPWPALLGLLLALTSLNGASDLSSVIKYLETGFEISILKKPERGTLKLARFNNRVKSITLRKEGQEIPQELTPFPSHWEIKLSGMRDFRGSTVFVETVGPPQLAGKVMIIEPTSSGTLALHAHLAIPVGKEIRYKPQIDQNAIGFWRNMDDYLEWHFQPSKTGKYRVIIHQSCGAKLGGSLAEFRIGEEILKYKVKDTGDFNTFEARRAGILKIESTDPHTLQLHITRLAKYAAMDVRLIELVPLD